MHLLPIRLLPRTTESQPHRPSRIAHHHRMTARLGAVLAFVGLLIAMDGALGRDILHLYMAGLVLGTLGVVISAASVAVGVALDVQRRMDAHAADLAAQLDAVARAEGLTLRVLEDELAQRRRWR